MAFQSGCRLENLTVASPSLRRCFINNNTIYSLFLSVLFFVYLVASINKLELETCKQQRRQHRSLVYTNFHKKVFRQARSNSNFRFCSFIKTHHRLDQDFRQTFLSHGPFHHSSWYSVKCLIQINRTRVGLHSFVFRSIFFLQPLYYG